MPYPRGTVRCTRGVRHVVVEGYDFHSFAVKQFGKSKKGDEEGHFIPRFEVFGSGGCVYGYFSVPLSPIFESPWPYPEDEGSHLGR